jgi:hypothetical protein
VYEFVFLALRIWNEVRTNLVVMALTNGIENLIIHVFNMHSHWLHYKH